MLPLAYTLAAGTNVAFWLVTPAPPYGVTITAVPSAGDPDLYVSYSLSTALRLNETWPEFVSAQPGNMSEAVALPSAWVLAPALLAQLTIWVVVTAFTNTSFVLSAVAIPSDAALGAYSAPTPAFDSACAPLPLRYMPDFTSALAVATGNVTFSNNICYTVYDLLGTGFVTTLKLAPPTPFAPGDFVSASFSVVKIGSGNYNGAASSTLNAYPASQSSQARVVRFDGVVSQWGSGSGAYTVTVATYSTKPLSFNIFIQASGLLPSVTPAATPTPSSSCAPPQPSVLAWLAKQTFSYDFGGGFSLTLQPFLQATESYRGKTYNGGKYLGWTNITADASCPGSGLRYSVQMYAESDARCTGVSPPIASTTVTWLCSTDSLTYINFPSGADCRRQYTILTNCSSDGHALCVPSSGTPVVAAPSTVATSVVAATDAGMVAGIIVSALVTVAALAVIAVLRWRRLAGRRTTAAMEGVAPTWRGDDGIGDAPAPSAVEGMAPAIRDENGIGGAPAAAENYAWAAQQWRSSAVWLRSSSTSAGVSAELHSAEADLPSFADGRVDAATVIETAPLASGASGCYDNGALLINGELCQRADHGPMALTAAGPLPRASYDPESIGDVTVLTYSSAPTCGHSRIDVSQQADDAPVAEGSGLRTQIMNNGDVVDGGDGRALDPSAPSAVPLLPLRGLQQQETRRGAPPGTEPSQAALDHDPSPPCPLRRASGAASSVCGSDDWSDEPV